MLTHAAAGRARAIAHVLTMVAIRAFQAAAYAEGALLPAILVVAVVHWLTGQAATLVAVVGATHGTAFTVYILLVPALARLLHWSARTTSVAFSVAFVPFAPWAFERNVRAELTHLLHHREGAVTLARDRGQRGEPA